MDVLVNNIYKPRRILHYLKASKEDIENFYHGVLPEELLKYDGEFGTYDSPGLFRIREDGYYKEVLGIEYRPDDDRLNYPVGMDTMILEPSFMLSVLFTNDRRISDARVDECINYITYEHKEIFSHREVVPNPDPAVVEIFTTNNKNRVYFSAKPVTYDEFFKTKEPVTEEEKALYNVAYRDFITGHYNWNYINPIIFGYGLKGLQDFIFVHFDVKDFNTLNVIYGHGVANNVLRKITKHMSEQDWIYYSARCDNDNFAMMIKDMKDEEVRAKLLKFFDEISILDEDKHYHIFYRCGVVPMRNCLLLSDRVADGAKLAQRMGQKFNETEVRMYTDVMHDELDWAKKVKTYLPTAIENDEFLVYLQPKYDINTEKIRGAEALIRWKYQGKEMMSPFRFIPILERDGSISKVDDIVLKKVCEYFVRWKEMGLPLFPISVNLSRKRMENPELIDHLTKIVDSFGIDHSLIDFELTESAAYDDQDYMVSVISRLKDRGFKISMDDFGTGFSSLSLLTVMPFDTLKIDKSFVDGIGTDKETHKEVAVVEHIISMAKALDFIVLAEGAEQKVQVEKLKAMGCEYIQGYYFSKPLPADEYEAKLVEQKNA